jgi:hypothetical protein
LAAKKAGALKPYGYNIMSVGNASNTSYVQTQIIDLTRGKKKHTRQSLEQRFGITATSELPDNTIRKQGADFVIILGSDEAAPAQH